MKSLWNDDDAKGVLNNPLSLRVYSSRLLGQEDDLVLHGGGNTSVKATLKNMFGESEEILYVKGSGWDLATIEVEGFAPVRQNVLLKMAELTTLSDTEMVKNQRAAMIDPYAPNPSVEAILHAIIPFTFVDHTHADAVVTLTNTPHGKEIVESIYGDRVLIVPYVMPGFILAKTIYEMTRDCDWNQFEGIILLNHGIFTFHHDAKTSYENMIRLVSEAEAYIAEKSSASGVKQVEKKQIPLNDLAAIRQSVSLLRGSPVLVALEDDDQSVNYSLLKNLESVALQGPLTPDHVIRTKRIPVIFSGDIKQSIKSYAENYRKYFDKHSTDHLTCLDSAPRWAVWPSFGRLCFGTSVKENQILADITEHTIKSILQAEALGGWRALPQQDIFDIEYWELEQAKLKKSGQEKKFQGKIAIVTGAAGGIGRACLDYLYAHGAVAVGLDIDKKMNDINLTSGYLGIVCDLTVEVEVEKAINQVIRKFGGLDMLICNAGMFPPGDFIENVSSETWKKSMDLNLTSHQKMLQAAIPFLKLGIDSSVVIIASKNVPAPGPGASAYSVAKAGLMQLGRVAALELAKDGIRVNLVHPNQVFDTGIWTEEVLSNRARHYNVSVDDYKKNNLLGVEILSSDVAHLVGALLGSDFSKTTGAQIPIDGGNERVI